MEDVSTSHEEDATSEVETTHPPEDLTGTSAKTSPSVPLRLSNLLAHPEAHPIALDLLFLKGFGPSFVEWDPDTVVLRAPELKCGPLSDPNFQKLQACRAMHLVDTFWLDWEVFALLTCALDGEPPSVEVLRVPSVAQCALAVEVANQIRDDVPWSGEVKQFLAQVFRYEGVLFPPECCSFVPVEVGDLVRVDRVLADWPSVLKSGAAPVGESPEAEQLRRMLVLHRDIEAARDRLADQRRTVANVPFRSL